MPTGSEGPAGFSSVTCGWTSFRRRRSRWGLGSRWRRGSRRGLGRLWRRRGRRLRRLGHGGFAGLWRVQAGTFAARLFLGRRHGRGRAGAGRRLPAVRRRGVDSASRAARGAEPAGRRLGVTGWTGGCTTGAGGRHGRRLEHRLWHRRAVHRSRLHGRQGMRRQQGVAVARVARRRRKSTAFPGGMRTSRKSDSYHDGHPQAAQDALGHGSPPSVHRPSRLYPGRPAGTQGRTQLQTRNDPGRPAKEPVRKAVGSQERGRGSRPVRKEKIPAFARLPPSYLKRRSDPFDFRPPSAYWVPLSAQACPPCCSAITANSVSLAAVTPMRSKHSATMLLGAVSRLMSKSMVVICDR